MATHALAWKNKLFDGFLPQSEFDRLGFNSRGWRIPSEEGKQHLSQILEGIDMLVMEYVKFYEGEHSGFCFTLEDYMEGGDFVKYNNNTTYYKDLGDPNSVIAQVFSHYSLVCLTILSKTQCTNNTEMVVDIQGVGLRLTDPVIHSTSMGLDYGNTNLGILGICEFFKVHNALNLPCCKILGTFNMTF